MISFFSLLCPLLTQFIVSYPLPSNNKAFDSFLATPVLVTDIFTCKARADIAFVIDSASKTKKGFENEKQFIKSVARAFDVSDSGVHLNLVPVTSDSSKPVKYIETKNASDFFKFVDGLKFLGGSERIDEALKAAYNGLFRPSHEERLNVPQVLVLLTDGVHEENGNKDASLSHAVLPFLEASIKIIVVGVNARSGRKDLETLVKNSNDLFMVDSLDTLVSNRFINSVAAAACQPGKKNMLFCLLIDRNL